MELRHIKYFMAIAEEGSFTKAAEKLMIAQPPLSRQIRELETELGVTLFTRGKGKSTSLTPEGMVFLSYSQRIIGLVEEAASCFSGTAEAKAALPVDTTEIMVKAQDLYKVLSVFMQEVNHEQ